MGSTAISLVQWQRRYAGEFVALDRKRKKIIAHSRDPHEVVRRVRGTPRKDLIVTFLPKSPVKYLLFLG